MTYIRFEPKSSKHHPTHSTTWTTIAPCYNLANQFFKMYLHSTIIHNKYLFFYLIFFSSLTTHFAIPAKDESHSNHTCLEPLAHEIPIVKIASINLAYNTFFTSR